MENNKNGWTDSGNRTHVCVKSAGPELNLSEGWLWLPWLCWDLLICALCIFSFQSSDPSGGFANKAVWIWKGGHWGGLALLLICNFTSLCLSRLHSMVCACVVVMTLEVLLLILAQAAALVQLSYQVSTLGVHKSLHALALFLFSETFHLKMGDCDRVSFLIILHKMLYSHFHIALSAGCFFQQTGACKLCPSQSHWGLAVPGCRM